MGVYLNTSEISLSVKYQLLIIMKGLFVATTIASVLCVTNSQLKFGGSSSSSSSSSGSSPSNKNTNSGTNTDTRFLSTGSELIDGGVLGLGAGLLGGAVLSGALNGGNNQGYNNPCGRRRRQADDGTNTKFFSFGGSSGCNCGCNCGYNNYPHNNYPQNNYPQNNYPSSSNNDNLTFRDKYGNIHGACKKADQSGRTWCYTYGGCPDSQPSQRFPNNPWSYQACNYYG